MRGLCKIVKITADTPQHQLRNNTARTGCRHTTHTHTHTVLRVQSPPSPARPNASNHQHTHRLYLYDGRLPRSRPDAQARRTCSLGYTGGAHSWSEITQPLASRGTRPWCVPVRVLHGHRCLDHKQTTNTSWLPCLAPSARHRCCAQRNRSQGAAITTPIARTLQLHARAP